MRLDNIELFPAGSDLECDAYISRRSYQKMMYAQPMDAERSQLLREAYIAARDRLDPQAKYRRQAEEEYASWFEEAHDEA